MAPARASLDFRRLPGSSRRPRARLHSPANRSAELRSRMWLRSGIALVPEGRHIFASLTVSENLLLGATTRRDANAVPADIDRLLCDVSNSRRAPPPAGRAPVRRRTAATRHRARAVVAAAADHARRALARSCSDRGRSGLRTSPDAPRAGHDHSSRRAERRARVRRVRPRLRDERRRVRSQRRRRRDQGRSALRCRVFRRAHARRRRRAVW